MKNSIDDQECVAHVDASHIRQLTLDDIPLIMEFMEAAFSLLPGYYHELASAVEHHDTRRFHKLAHAIAGAARGVGLKKIGALAKSYEAAPRCPDDFDITRLWDVHEETKLAVREMLKELGVPEEKIATLCWLH